MNQQWQNLLQNLGEWQGSFTRFSPSGDEQDSVPTIVTLKGLTEGLPEDGVDGINQAPVNQVQINFNKVRITVNYLNDPDRNVDITFGSLGRDFLAHETGAFSQGSMQVAPLGSFGAELGIPHGERRLRVVQRFSSRILQGVTLIREALPQATTPERSLLTPGDIQGTWTGTAHCLYADLRPPCTYRTTTHISQTDDRLTIATRSDSGETLDTFIQTTPRQWVNPSTPSQNQLLFLPDGSLSLCPQTVPLDQSFALEVVWQVQPQQRYRLRREYDRRGTWVGLTWFTEERLPKT